MVPRPSSGWSSFVARVSGLFGLGGAAKDARKQPVATQARDTTDALVEARRKNTGMALQTLRSSLKAGRITQEEYAARVAHLSETSSSG